MGEHPFMEGADVVDGSLNKKTQGRPNNRNRPSNKNSNNRNRNRNKK